MQTYVCFSPRVLWVLIYLAALLVAVPALSAEPKTGAEWLDAGRTALQAVECGKAAECFAKAAADAALGAELRARAGQLASLARRFARQQATPGTLCMPQNTWLGKALRDMGETELGDAYVQKGAEELDAVRAQVADAITRLKKDNPEMRAFVKPITETDQVMLRFSGANLTNISALAGLPVTGLYLDSNPVADLSPVKGMPLTEISLAYTQVTDIAVLQGMPLRIAKLPGIPVKSLAPLAGAPLEELNTGGTRIDNLSMLAGLPLRGLSIICDAKDISPLRDMPLEFLNLGPAMNVENFSVLATLKHLKSLTMFSATIRDLSVLKGLPLERLQLMNCLQALDLRPLKTLPLKVLDVSQVAERDNIAALAGLPLEDLAVDRTRVSELTWLKGMKLRRLLVTSYAPIADYSVLTGMPLEDLTIGWMPARLNPKFVLLPDTLGLLKDIPTLKSVQLGILGKLNMKDYEQILTIGTALKAANPDYKAGAFYHLENGVVNEVWLHACGVQNLAPLKNLGLTKLVISDAPVTDLSPLAGMPLRAVYLNNVAVTDLSPLKGMPLVALELTNTPVSNLAPVKGAPIEELNLTGSKVTDYTQLKGMKLKKIWLDEKMPAAALEILRKMDTLKYINDKDAWNYWPTNGEVIPTP